MAEQSDPRLELALRAALADEVATLPFRIRSEDVLGRARTRRGMGRLAWLAGAAAIVAAVGGLLLVGGSLRGTPPGPASEPGGAALEALPSFERLLGATTTGPELARAEGVGPGAGATMAGAIVAGRPAELVLACDGGSIGVSLVVDGVGRFLDARPCTGGLAQLAVPARDTQGATVASLSLDVPAGTAWRAVLAGGQSSAVVDAGTDEQPGLPTWNALRAMGSTGVPELVRASGSAGAGGVTYRIPGLGAPAALEILFTCDKGSVELSFASGPDVATQNGAPTVGCDGSVIVIQWPRTADQADASEIHVRPKPGTAWEALVREVPLASGAVGTP